MADVVYLHVGAPKTGTTYVQDRLFANRGTLGDHGIHYPVGLHGDMFAPALDLIQRRWGGMLKQVDGEWESLAARVRRTSGTVIISHEILAGATVEQASRALADLACPEVHVVYSARDLGRQIPAEWQESIKHRNRRKFGRYLREILESEPRDSDMWFWRVQGLPDVLNRWTQGLKPEHVHLVTVPHAGAAPNELWNRFCTALNIDPAWAPIETARANASLGIDETAMLRRLNRRLKGSDVDGAAYRQLVRQRMVHDKLAGRPKMRKVTLPPEQHEWAHGIAEDWIEWINGSGIQVVGDVEELRPVFSTERAWQDPDKPKAGKVADAALDALVAALEEAADRPDPSQSPVAKIGRAARRLRGQ